MKRQFKTLAIFISVAVLLAFVLFVVNQVAAVYANISALNPMLGNVVLWKPAGTAVYSNYFIMKLLQEAGLPDGVINFIPCGGNELSDVVVADRNFAGIHFTGSTRVFEIIWQNIGRNIGSYKSYPRIVGETGGKDFVFAHHSCDVQALKTALIRGAFEYQGQKCSAASRAYLPASVYAQIKDELIADVQGIRVGSVEDFSNFMGAVIDQKAFDKITSYIDYAKESPEAELLCGGNYDDTTGYFIQPTIIKTTNPKFKTMEEEIFGPVLTLYVYQDQDFEQALQLCDQTSPYGLTGAIFAQDRYVITYMEEQLRHSAGNLYINDKPTGAVVGQQPFGGARKSGTNDKAGSKMNLMRWVTLRNIKENFNPPHAYRYKHMND